MAWLDQPIAVENLPRAKVFEPRAVDDSPDASVLAPSWVDCSPFGNGTASTPGCSAAASVAVGAPLPLYWHGSAPSIVDDLDPSLVQGPSLSGGGTAASAGGGTRALSSEMDCVARNCGVCCSELTPWAMAAKTTSAMAGPKLSQIGSS